MKVKAFFIGGPADGMTCDFESRPPDRMQATPESQGQFPAFPKPTIYSRNDLTGGTAVYVPTGTMLHDALVQVLESYVEKAKEEA
jgi:hypothetical protein